MSALPQSAPPQSGANPSSFGYDTDDVTVLGRFGVWAPCPGGYGRCIRMEMPVNDVCLTLSQNNTAPACPPFSGTVIAQAQLSAPVLPGRPSAAAPEAVAFTVVNVIYPASPPSVLCRALFEDVFGRWGTENLGDISRFLQQHQL